eukprot:TRINITY_DN120172_c2_g1_i1.p1 TRINITY_DN120172_c2_g1~~TRINITY_DN120172_c2_g1_i1.p1  ORF type:complete len:436 (+),score=12.25 TRINITY_DN120172_c2_g1_i1:155-1309(+)
MKDKATINESVLTPSSKPKQKPIGTVSLTATATNILLATCPFSLPYALIEGGLILGLLLFIFSAFLATNSTDMLMETMGITSAIEYSPSTESDFQETKEDREIIDSPYFIKQKFELFSLCKIHINRPFTILSILILVLFLLGSMVLKCVSSCISLTEALSFALYGSLTAAYDIWPVDPYIFAVVAFAMVATFFGLGNIEGSKPLQVFVMVLRFFMIYLMIIGSIYSIFTYGPADFSKIKLFDITRIDYSLSNIMFATFMHHSITGMVYPLRPQSKVKQTFRVSYALQTLSMIVHCALAIVAFGDKQNTCEKFPCRIREIFNITFMSLPIVGPIVQFFPSLAIAVFAVLGISLRNNLMQVLGINATVVSSFFYNPLRVLVASKHV